MTDMSSKQQTLADQIRLSGIGVHSGEPASLTLYPADENTGIVFVRTGADGSEVEIDAIWSAVSATALCTVIGKKSASVCTIEHLMAALRGLGVDNVLVELDGDEVPVMDGSAIQFVDAIDQVGLVKQAALRRYIRIKKPIRVENKGAVSELRPYEGMRFDVTIDFETPLIGRQSFVGDLTPELFRTEIARARTFGRVSDVEKLWAMGFARGSSLENSVAIDGDRVLNPEGTRWADEFVRHKTLDAVGDLALSGLPILGEYRSFKAGHAMNNAVLIALFSDEDAYEIVEGPARRERESRPVDLTSDISAPAYGPDHS
ncbi:UDP-3-O-acyl-N-acetylglucosamine deacetylase [Breoghania sp. L-A4]|uniref:UDP-3-O-acyl-N-acetylglucosamine deacetylase n=1 Tax=Breoghania sp. L-A4 TaxID=2304600 RepID=UPI000E35E65E|nr:UDP-3-O-acyl-N-acetylglucosamine deacetylase [Breoghania sp. L-A4]AXS41330.1 UDP-3-O-acyl-N-acetylglucosamine deacetylase [Breoghania sp. L-A4]